MTYGGKSQIMYFNIIIMEYFISHCCFLQYSTCFCNKRDGQYLVSLHFLVNNIHFKAVIFSLDYYYHHKIIIIVVIVLDCGVPPVWDSGGVNMEHVNPNGYVLCLRHRT